MIFGPLSNKASSHALRSTSHTSLQNKGMTNHVLRSHFRDSLQSETYTTASTEPLVAVTTKTITSKQRLRYKRVSDHHTGHMWKILPHRMRPRHHMEDVTRSYVHSSSTRGKKDHVSQTSRQVMGQYSPTVRPRQISSTSTFTRSSHHSAPPYNMINTNRTTHACLPLKL